MTEAVVQIPRSLPAWGLLGVRYRLGTRIMVDVLNAQQQLYTAQRDLVKAKYDVLLQSLKLRAAAGTLSDEDVINLNRLFVQ